MITNIYQKIKTVLENFNFVFYWRNENDEPPTIIQNKIYFTLKLNDVLFIDLIDKKQIAEAVFEINLFASMRNETEYLNNLQTIFDFFENFYNDVNLTNNLVLMQETLNINYIPEQYRFEINVKIKGK